MKIVPACLLMVGVLLIIMGCWSLIRTYHMLKITIGIEIAMKGVTLFMILAGCVTGKINITQTFVITVIVLEVIVALVGTGTAVGLFTKYASMDVRNLNRLKG